MKSTRAYTMTARAEAVELTRQRILQACFELSSTVPVSSISLDRVATDAGVSVQTVLRQFGSRADLLAAAMEFANAAVTEERRAPVGDVAEAIRIVMDHYELRGDTALLMLSQEDADEQVRAMTDMGKEMHRRWVREVFAPYVDGDATVDLLVVATDVYAWKLLRRDRGLSRAQTEHRMRQLVSAVLAGVEKGRPS